MRGNLQSCPSHQTGVQCRFIVGRVRIVTDQRHLSIAEGRRVVDGGELDDGGEDEEETDADEQVECRRVGDAGQVLSVVDPEEGHRQHRRDACNVDDTDGLTYSSSPNMST